MNKYGLMAKNHWAENLPTRYTDLENPEDYFQSLGEQVADQVQALEMRLAGADLPGEQYLDKLGRLNAARLQAEEIVLADLVWLDPEVSAEEAFQEWAATAPFSAQQIGNWADDTQLEAEETEREPAQASVDDMADRYGLPKSFFQELLATPVPWAYLSSHKQQVQDALRTIWVRESAAG